MITLVASFAVALCVDRFPTQRSDRHKKRCNWARQLYIPTSKCNLYPECKRDPISRPQKGADIPTAKGTLYPDRKRYLISWSHKVRYTPTAKGILYPDRTRYAISGERKRYPISRPQKEPYIPTAEGTLYPDRNRYPISRTQKVPICNANILCHHPNNYSDYMIIVLKLLDIMDSFLIHIVKSRFTIEAWIQSARSLKAYHIMVSDRLHDRMSFVNTSLFLIA